MKTVELIWTDSGNRRRGHIIDPDTTKVKAVAKAGRGFIEAHAIYRDLERELSAAQGDPKRLAYEAKLAAREAGSKGEAVDSKKLRKKVREAEERLAELELEFEAAFSKFTVQRREYLDILEHHAPALAAEAQADAEASILSLATASSMARRASAEMSGALSILGGLGSVQDESADFVPKAPKARKREVGVGTAPVPYVGTAVDSITTAIGLATEILDDMKKAEKERRSHDAAEAESDALTAAPDALDGETVDEGDDDEDDER